MLEAKLPPLSQTRFEYNGKVRPLKNIFKDHPKTIFLLMRRRYGEPKNPTKTFRMVEDMCLNRDCKDVLGMRSIAVSLHIAFGDLDEVYVICDRIFQEIFVEGDRDSIFMRWKKIVVRYRNNETGNLIAKKREEEEITKSEYEIGTLEFDIECYLMILGRYEHTDQILDRFWSTSILSQTRGLPTGNADSTTNKVIEFMEGLTRPYPEDSRIPLYNGPIPLRNGMVRLPYYAYRDGVQQIETDAPLWDDRLYQGAKELGKLVAQDIKERILAESRKHDIPEKSIIASKKDYHCSLTSSSSYEYTRETGGKWNVLKENGPFYIFLNNPIEENFKLDHDLNKFVDYLGKSVCDVENAHMETWRIAYLTEPLSGVFGEVICPGYLEAGTEAFANGIDTRLGSLLFMWSHKERDNFEQNYDYRDVTTYPQGKVTIIKEPGVKIRPVTSGETWLNVFLSPAAHMLKKFLETLPACRVGLGDAANLYKFSCEFAGELKEDECISTSDMTSATDRATHDWGFGVLKGLIDEMRSLGMISKLEQEYLIKASSLLNTPKLLSFTCKGRQAKMISKAWHDNRIGLLTLEKKRGERGSMKTFEFVNTRGIMMGDPLTKIVLTMSSYAAWKMTKITRKDDPRDFRLPRRENRSEDHSTVKAFACAGDDHIGLGTFRDLKRIPKVMEKMNFEISWDKYDINNNYVSYCQDFGIKGELNEVTRIRARREPKEANFIHIDIPKIRLLNQFQKMGGNENFSSPDPLVGKAMMLEGQNEYFDSMLKLRDYLVDTDSAAVRRYFDRLETYMDYQSTYIRLLMPSWMEPKLLKKVETYIPSWLGGIGVRLPKEISWVNRHAYSYARKFTGFMAGPVLDGSIIEWERGITQNITLINKYVELGTLDKPLTTPQLYNKVKEELAMSIASGSNIIGARKIWDSIHKNYINACGPLPIVSSRENAYTALSINPKLGFTVVKPLRARQKISRTWQKIKYVDFVGPILLNRTRREDIWVGKTGLAEALGTGFVKPSTQINLSLFSGGNVGQGPRFIPNNDELRDMSSTGSIDTSIGEGLIEDSLSSSSQYM